MAIGRKTGGVLGAAGAAVAAVLGFNQFQKPPEPAQVRPSLCKAGKLEVPVKWSERQYKVGEPCIVVVPAKKKR